MKHNIVMSMGDRKIEVIGFSDCVVVSIDGTDTRDGNTLYLSYDKAEALSIMLTGLVDNNTNQREREQRSGYIHEP